jgi:hypothetical protein
MDTYSIRAGVLLIPSENASFCLYVTRRAFKVQGRPCNTRVDYQGALGEVLLKNFLSIPIESLEPAVCVDDLVPKWSPIVEAKAREKGTT